MVIYYAMTKFHLIFSIVHKMENYREQEAVLFLYSGLQGVEMNAARILECGIFDEVYVVPEIELRKGWEPLGDDSTDAQIEKNMELLANEVKKWLPVKISAKDTIFIANDQWALGTYCIYYHIPYIYYEDGVGMLSKPEYSYELVRKLNVTHAVLAKYMGAFGQNAFVIKKLADMENQTPGFSDEKAEHYSLREKLELLSKGDMEKLLYIFDAPKCKADEKTTILLTEHFVNMKRLSIEEQRELYSLLVDMFSDPNQLYIKPHPNDYAVDYKALFADGRMISRKFPSELLPYCFEGRLDLGLAACSTSVYGLKNILNRTIRFDIDIENHYRKLIKYDALVLLQKNFAEKSIYGWNIYQDLIDAFGIQVKRLGDEAEENTENSVLLVDDRGDAVCEDAEWERRLEAFSTVVFFNTDVALSVCREPGRLLPVIISKHLLDDEKIITDDGDEVLWIYTEDDKLWNLLKGKKVTKKMKNTRVILDIRALTDDKDIQLKMLEGNLESALTRIQGYAENEKALKKRISDLENELAYRDKRIMESLSEVLEKSRVE